VDTIIFGCSVNSQCLSNGDRNYTYLGTEGGVGAAGPRGCQCEVRVRECGAVAQRADDEHSVADAQIWLSDLIFEKIALTRRMGVDSSLVDWVSAATHLASGGAKPSERKKEMERLSPHILRSARSSRRPTGLVWAERLCGCRGSDQGTEANTCKARASAKIHRLWHSFSRTLSSYLLCVFIAVAVKVTEIHRVLAGRAATHACLPCAGSHQEGREPSPPLFRRVWCRQTRPTPTWVTPAAAFPRLSPSGRPPSAVKLLLTQTGVQTGGLAAVAVMACTRACRRRRGSSERSVV
jgi:hypothetical protein